MTPTRSLGQGEFVALVAMLFATIALSIDAMLPALPEIALSLSPDAPNRAQLVITSFVFGLGLGTLFAGPLSDAYGRKAVIQAGLVLYVVASLACWLAGSLEWLLLARAVQGIGAAGPRTVTIAMVRDLFEGRAMAQVMSVAMMFFTIVPAIAPLMGQGVMSVANWKVIFLVYLFFAGIAMLWLGLRQPETLPPAARRAIALSSLWTATKEVLRNRTIVISILVQSLTLAALFGTLSSMQGIFEQRFDRAGTFPLWFCVIALASASGSLLNAKVVIALGMRRVVTLTFAGMLVLTLAHLAVVGLDLLPDTAAFAAHILWSIGLFSMMGLTMGNLNALAMEPVGHIAGLAASVISSIATVLSVALAVPVGLAFNGTALPLMLGVTVFSAASLVLMVRMPGRT